MNDSLGIIVSQSSCVSVVESDVIRSLTLALAGRPSLCGRPEQPPQSGTKELGRTEAAAGGAGDPVRNR